MTKKTVSQIGEFGLIEKIQKSFSNGSSVLKGIGDDAAIVSLSEKKYIVLTTDMLVEDVHFKKSMPAEAIGHKAMACSLSDVAAMGGSPKFALVSLGIPSRLPVKYVKSLYKGMEKMAARFSTSIVGGDTVKSQKIIINVSLLGSVAPKHGVCRSGAKKGDIIFVTGPLGRSLKSGWHLKFIPRLKESQFLVQNCKPSAMIDVSDGLIADLGHILAMSRTGAILDETKIPLRKKATLRQALYDGEDFELLFSMSPQKAGRLAKFALKGMRFYPIGEIIGVKQKIQLKRKNGLIQNLDVKGYVHF